MSNRIKQRKSEARFEARESTLAASDPTPPFSFSTTTYRYDETDCDFVYRRRRLTAHLEGVRYYGYRYYNPDLGRWVNRDPIGGVVIDSKLIELLERTDPASLKRGENEEVYLIGQNNIIDRFDLLGFDWRFRYLGLHRTVEIRSDDGASRYFDWTGIDDPEDASEVACVCAYSLGGGWVPGKWREITHGVQWMIGIPGPWHNTSPEEDSKLIKGFSDAVDEGVGCYNLYLNNSFQAPKRMVDEILNPAPPKKDKFIIPWKTLKVMELE